MVGLSLPLQPALSVLIPTSPMPITGFTCIVLKREVVDLNITIDQALEYIISCGVVVPPHQLQLAMRRRNESERGRKPTSRQVDSRAGQENAAFNESGLSVPAIGHSRQANSAV